MPSPKVFVSYSHRDRDAKALQQLQRFLTPLERDGVVSVWADTELKGGDDWKQEIFQALAEATVAVLLISQDFLASDFITREEIPRILQREAEGRLKVLPVFLSPSSVDDVGYPDPAGRTKVFLSKFQGFGTPQKPLATLEWSAREKTYADLAKQLRGLTGAGLAPIPLAAGSTSPAPVPARAYELTVQLEDRGETILASYHLPGREPIGSATVLWADVKRRIDPVHDALDRMISRALLPQLGDPNGWGEALFDLLFGPVDRWERIFRTLFGRPTGAQPNPPLFPVRLRVHTEEPRLSSLPRNEAPGPAGRLQWRPPDRARRVNWLRCSEAQAQDGGSVFGRALTFWEEAYDRALKGLSAEAPEETPAHQQLSMERALLSLLREGEAAAVRELYRLHAGTLCEPIERALSALAPRDWGGPDLVDLSPVEADAGISAWHLLSARQKGGAF